MSFNEKYNEIVKLVEYEIEDLKRIILSDINECQELQKVLIDFFNLSSKHIRPVLSFLYIKALNMGIDKRQIQYQAIIEIIHNASLIHDDIIDDSNIRRGEKSLNANLGNHMSVVVGDLILSYALKKVAELKSIELLLLLSNTILKMCRGEIFLQYKKYQIPSLEDYIEKTYNKTGALFNAAIQGAIIIGKGNVDDKEIEFARNFGIAFQIRDDIKNITDTGKSTDIENGIYTAPVIYSQSICTSAEGIEKAKSLLNNYIEKAKSAISGLDNNKYKTAIIELLELINHE